MENCFKGELFFAVVTPEEGTAERRSRLRLHDLHVLKEMKLQETVQRGIIAPAAGLN